METTCIPRPEYPRPQFVRNEWLNLNGTWEFEFDYGNTGIERKLFEKDHFSKEILVPFCPESRLSGIEQKDFMNAVWYKRDFFIPEEWAETNRTLLHFGAVDYHCKVWINGQSVGEHKGGYTPFTFDITDFLKKEGNTITVYAQDDNRNGLQPRGKQSEGYESTNCVYTRATGIWQTVWLESVPCNAITRVTYIPNISDGSFHVSAEFSLAQPDFMFRVRAFYQGTSVGGCTSDITGSSVSLNLSLQEKHLWEPGRPELYDLQLELISGGEVVDCVQSYCGLREISLQDGAICINKKIVFQRLVLDQGYYPDGIYTAPDDDAIRRDIELSLALGFNGARLHEKVFEQRYLYWADRLGYLVWGEYPNWGLDMTSSKALEIFLPEWMEALKRDFNAPAVVGWCPFNETWDKDCYWDENGAYVPGIPQDDKVLSLIYDLTKSLDPTRPVIDTSGNFHVITDIFDVHEYEQTPEKFKAKFEPMKTDGDVYVTYPSRQSYDGQPYFVSEYGGIWWSEQEGTGWGYGIRPADKEEFISRYRGLTEALLDHPKICGFCYTQLYDVEQEQNGLYTYERECKFDSQILRDINIRPAAIEKS